MKKLALLIIVGLLSITLFFNGCIREDSNLVNQDAIWTSYTLLYNANEDKTYAQAIFKFSNATGAHLHLSDSAKVTFNGELLSFKPVLAYYEKEYAGLIETGTFEYTDLDGNVFVNTASPIIATAFPTNVDTISRDAAFELVWQGNPLSEGESMWVSTDGDFEDDARLFIQDDVNSSSIVLGKDRLEALPEGAADFFMTRLHTTTAMDGTSHGGIMYSKYRAEDTQFIMK